jgi:hypothetical protein
MRYYQLFFVLFALHILTSGFSCSNNMLKVHNSSKEKITVLYSNTGKPSSDQDNNIAYYIADYVIIKPDSVNSIRIGGKKNAWHNYIERGKDKQLYLYIFSVDSLKQYDGYSMNELCSMGKYLKVLKYSEPELIKMNWRVDYKEESPTPLQNKLYEVNYPAVPGVVLNKGK